MGQHNDNDYAGIIDGLGYLYCKACAERLGKTPQYGKTSNYPMRVEHGSNPHSHEECDHCHKRLDGKEAENTNA